MTVDPAVAALAFPLVMLSLMGLAFTAAAARGRAAVARMNRHGSSLYLGILVAYAVAALVATGSRPAQLGLVPRDGDAAGWALRTLALSIVGIGAARLLLLADLEIALRRSRRGARDGGETVARAERATQGRWFAALATGFALAEELLWRGVGVREVQAVHTAESEVLVVALGVVLFGLCHLYFGIGAVVSKSVCGGAWTLLTIAAAGILPAIVSHVAYQVLVERWNRGRADRAIRSRRAIEPVAP